MRRIDLPAWSTVEKLEFVITDACTGRCRHCSQGDHSHGKTVLDAVLGAEIVTAAAGLFSLQTVMTFGGEPLLFPESVFAIHRAAKAAGIPRRQVITNGFFSPSISEIRAVAQELARCGVNDLLLSVDAFHQETIPLEFPLALAEAAKRCGLPLRLQPAWLISDRDENPYNRSTREILEQFKGLGCPVGAGNVIFPEGNAAKYLASYFKAGRPENPYRQDPGRMTCLSVNPDGTLADSPGGDALRFLTAPESGEGEGR